MNKKFQRVNATKFVSIPVQRSQVWTAQMVCSLFTRFC